MTADTPARTTKGALHRGTAPAVVGRPLLDHLVHISPMTSTILYVPVAVAGVLLSLGRSGPPALAGWAFAGYLAWTLSEYWGHRLLLHFEPERGIGARAHYILHGVHHDYPQDARRSILSPVLSIPMIALTFWLSSGVLGLPPVFGAGYVAGYLAYDLLHCYLHRGRPKSRILRTLRTYHMRHHFLDDRRGFGISAPYWDRVFGTSVARTPQ
ncbi:sterol desaturase family protein [Streptomyces sp. NPDC005283]|uniref:sterol desaturase family protein n=1 Tax=Streptomyces sp. NPDC005283 TaxID=3156871 RepID=UPI003453C2BB